MADRIRYNFKYIRGLAKDPKVQELVQEQAKRIASKADALGSGTRTDLEVGPRRVRGAVIAGYEPGATAENTRCVLLSSLDGE